MEIDDNSEPFGPPIYAYTRKQAAADGEQVDVSQTAAEAGIRFPTFLTRTVYDGYVAVPPGVVGQDEAGRLSHPAFDFAGKEKKERTCPLWPETARLLLELLEEQGVSVDRPEAVFRNRCGARLTRFGVRFILRKHIANAIPRVPSLKHKRLHPHSLRHGTAIHLLRAGVDLSTIAHWMGHASLNTTTSTCPLISTINAKRWRKRNHC